MKPASSAKRAKRAKAAAKAAKDPRFSRSAKSKSGGKSGLSKKSGGSAPGSGKRGGSGAGLDQSHAPGGGTIDHARPTMGRQEIHAVTQLMRAGTIEPGAEVGQFEEEFCRFLGLPSGHALALSSSSAAFYLALRVLEAQGKTVAVSVYANSALIEAVKFADARELLVDVAEGSVHMNAGGATAGGATIAIVSHTFGLPARTTMEALKNQTIIEDCGDALGSKIGENYTGLQGALGVYSFDATGLITCAGQGGMLVSRDRALIDRARQYVQGSGTVDGAQHFDFRMGEMQAAVGRVQLAKLPNFLARREEIFSHYQDADFDLINSDDPDVTPVRYRAVMRVQSPQKMVEYLGKGMIKTVVPFAGEVSAFAGDKFPHAAALCNSTISIPIYPHLTNDELVEVIEQIDIALEHCN